MDEYSLSPKEAIALSCSEIPNSSDSISRQAAIDALDRIFNNVPMELTTEILRFRRELRALPSADVAPVVHGRWLPIVSYNNTYKCSECGRLLMDNVNGLNMIAKHYPYCHCGAKMDGHGES